MAAPPSPDDELGRARLTQTKRIELLERDRAQQSRMITEIVDKVGKGFTEQQLAQIRAAMREELAEPVCGSTMPITRMKLARTSDFSVASVRRGTARRTRWAAPC